MKIAENMTTEQRMTLEKNAWMRANDFTIEKLLNELHAFLERG